MYSLSYFVTEEKEQESKEQEKDVEDETLSYEYDLIGVTVHTGTADGGHYYSFIRDRSRDKWFLFNDAEVKPFDPKQIAAECFGGEMIVSYSKCVLTLFKLAVTDLNNIAQFEKVLCNYTII